MSAEDKMCSYSEKLPHHRGALLNENGFKLPAFRAVEVRAKEWRPKRKRVTCPVCKRRMWGWEMISHDADRMGFIVPPHKRKGWWKKNKKKKDKKVCHRSSIGRALVL